MPAGESLRFRVAGEPRGRIHTQSRAIQRSRCPACKSEHLAATDPKTPNLRECGTCGKIFYALLTVSAPDGSSEQYTWLGLVQTTALAAVNQYGWKKAEAGAVSLHLEFIMHRPKGLYWKGPHAEPRHWKLPDRDNLEKGFCDACKGILWRDDSQIAEGSTSKRYAHPGEQTGVVVVIANLGEWMEDEQFMPEPEEARQEALLL